MAASSIGGASTVVGGVGGDGHAVPPGMRRGRSSRRRQIRTGDRQIATTVRRGRASTVRAGIRSATTGRGCARRGDPWVAAGCCCSSATPGSARPRSAREAVADGAPRPASRALGGVLGRRGHGGPRAMAVILLRPRPGRAGAHGRARSLGSDPDLGAAASRRRRASAYADGASAPSSEATTERPGAARARRPALGRRGHPAAARRGRRPPARPARARRRHLPRHRRRGRLAADPARRTAPTACACRARRRRDVGTLLARQRRCRRAGADLADRMVGA